MSSRGLSEQAFLVLTVLVEHPQHGYAVLRMVDELSDGRVQLRVGTLYGVLDRLANDGLVELDREEVHQGRLRRYYRATDKGVRVLGAETHRLAANVNAATAVLGARGVQPKALGGLA
ncbi:PadR family transcriptional regulator [Amycolatopsis sp. NPDC023774]|uniref:PadR family transcriptional regulator n=1 Tax=Amycolatopsis sp. NPDC023774 TaxID=3155015 RepID=UPI0033D0409D